MTAQERQGHLASRTAPGGVTWLDIVVACAATAGARVADVVAGQRTKSATLGRHRAWFVLHERAGYSYPEIGRVFGVDHTTVVDAVHRIARMP